MPSILLVDSETDSRLKTTQVLVRAGHEVRAVSSFEQAKNALRDRVPDVLITDLRLGAFNGIQLVLRRIDHPGMAAVVRHTCTDAVLEAEVRRLGAAFLVKSPNMTALLSLVDRLQQDSVANRGAGVRRWTRKRVADGVAAKIAEIPVKVVDMCYGGLRLELTQEPSSSLPAFFEVGFSSGIAVRAQQVWSSRATESGIWWCGVEVIQNDAANADRWRGFVDSTK